MASRGFCFNTSWDYGFNMGKITRINITSNKNLKKIYVSKGIDYCELGKRFNSKCSGKMCLSYAHRHKRIWYRGRDGLLSDFNQTILICISCHEIIEKDRLLTEHVFDLLRGEEVL